MKNVYKIITYILLTAGAIIMLFPFFWMITGSLKTYNQITASPIVWWPAPAQWGNYATALEYAPFDTYFVNTVIVSVGTTLSVLITSIFAAFAFSRLKFRGRDLIFSILLSTLMIPSQILIITNYVTVAVRMQLMDTLLALIIPFTASIFYIYLLREFFNQIPEQLYLAAKVDGTSDWRYLWRIMVPNAKNALITIGLFNFIASWNAYIWPLLLTNSESKRVLSIGLKYFSGEAGTDYELLMAAGTIVIAPLLVIYLFFRRYIVEGVARSGIKG
ncbi:MAG TPA: carbohydrate ABC transporter permease [Clostridia bacterium]|nr:carbohydrate ABC transporter permease [Clostridia bacterium]HPQ45814.1 carbohydrate ABC transporter permease [Clostridia bacterium]HRX42139.1 carbohydrate ABC transporter permease [Clostridia bacterium]